MPGRPETEARVPGGGSVAQYADGAALQFSERAIAFGSILRFLPGRGERALTPFSGEGLTTNRNAFRHLT